MTSRVNVDAHAYAVRVKQGDQETTVEPHGNKTFFVETGQTLTIEEVAPAEETKSEDAPKVPLKKPAAAGDGDKQTSV